MLAIGLMSGTSLDGIDACIIEIFPDEFKLLDFIMVPYSSLIKQKIMACSNIKDSNVQKICSLNFELGYLYVDAINKLLQKANISIEEIAYIAMHGQTIWHNPKQMGGYFSSTLQIGEPSIIAYHFNKMVISNFRVMDMAAGGDGAPLMPYAHYLMFKHLHQDIIILNIGGISNATYLSQDLNKIIAFDTGPGNMLIDGAMKILYQKSYDEDGAVATKGTIIEPVLAQLMKDDYLLKSYPKSTGREKYNDHYLKKIIALCQEYSKDNEDIITTITTYTALSFIDQYHRFFPAVPTIIISGGGANNKYIVSYLQSHLPQVEIQISEINDEMEAVGFALLGYATINNQTSNIINVTGAKKQVILGNITKPPLKGEIK